MMRRPPWDIPGKFVSSMQGGLPVLASINPGNDLAELIKLERVGRVCTDYSVDTLQRLAEDLLDEISSQGDMPARCRALSARLYSPVTAVRQVVAALGGAADRPGAVFKS